MTASVNGTDSSYLTTDSVTVTGVTAIQSPTGVTVNGTETVLFTDVTLTETTNVDYVTAVSTTSINTESATIITLHETSSKTSANVTSSLRTKTIVQLEAETSSKQSSSFSAKTSKSFTTMVAINSTGASTASSTSVLAIDNTIASSTTTVETKNTTSSSTTTEAIANTAASCETQIEKLCNDSTTVAIVVSVSAIVVLLVLVTSVICFFRLRHKWRSKIQLERKKTDIWSMATFNNTIINENFNDYQLATNDIRKSSGFSETSVRFYDPFSGSAPHTPFAIDDDNDIAQPSGNLPPEFEVDDSTLRRNTFSAPSGLNSSHKVLNEQDSSGPSDKRFTSRDRSSTFTAGKKHKIDRHVLLSHEEIVESSAPEHLAASYTTPTHSYHVTEL